MAPSRTQVNAVIAALFSGAAVAVGAGYPLDDASILGFVAALSALAPSLGDAGEVVAERVFGIEIAPGLLEGVSYLIEQAAALNMLGFVTVASGAFLLVVAVKSAWRKRSDN